MLMTAGKRLLMGVPTLVGVSVVIFLLLNILPGDPLAGLLAPDSTQADRDELAEQLGLNDPLVVRYVAWVGDLARGDLGYSFSRRRDVSELIWTAFKNTAILAAAAAVIGVSAGLTLGTLAALANGRWLDRAISMVAVVGLSVPQFWLAILLIIVFSAELRWLPASGMNSPDGNALTSLKFLIMPAIAASMVSIGNVTRMTRASLIQTYGEDFVMTLRAKGLHGGQILLHALKNAAPPIMTVAGLQVGFLLGGAVLVETIFSWPGMGQLIFQAIAARDLRVIQAAVLVLAVTFVVVNLVVDILQTTVNPRLRRGG
jgi:peptide/nickel transport system permease protein